MRNALTCLALVAGAASPVFATATMDVLSADRELFVIACGFDYEFNNCAGDIQSSQATSGFYDNQIIADLDDYYGNDIAEADGQIYSNITDKRIELEYFGVANVTDQNIFSADASVNGTTEVEFEVLDDVRVVFEGYADGYVQSYFTAGASLREVGGSTIASFAVQGQGQDDAEYVGWLYAGTYAVNADFVASAYADMPSAGEMGLSFRVYHKTDFNVDGAVNNADRGAFLAAYNLGSDDADYNGDGVVNITDRRSFLNDWRAAKAVK